MEDAIVTCKSKYDYETLKRFNRFHMYSKPMYKIVTVLAIFLILYAIIVPDELIIRLVIGLIGVVWLLEVIFLPVIYSKKALKTSALQAGAHIIVEFFDKKVKIETLKGEENIGNTTLDYNDIYKIYDTKHAIYIYVSSNQAFVCNKANIEGNYDNLVNMLKEKLGKKYKKKGK